MKGKKIGGRRCLYFLSVLLGSSPVSVFSFCVVWFLSLFSMGASHSLFGIFLGFIWGRRCVSGFNMNIQGPHVVVCYHSFLLLSLVLEYTDHTISC